MGFLLQPSGWTQPSLKDIFLGYDSFFFPFRSMNLPSKLRGLNQDWFPCFMRRETKAPEGRHLDPSPTAPRDRLAPHPGAPRTL